MTDTNSRVLIDDSAAADLPPRPERAIWSWDGKVEVQLPLLEKAEARRLLDERYGPKRAAVEVVDAKGDQADAAA